MNKTLHVFHVHGGTSHIGDVHWRWEVAAHGLMLYSKQDPSHIICYPWTNVRSYEVNDSNTQAVR
jgi:hypothetical protein